MADKIQVSIDVIVQATEDISKLFSAFEQVLKIKKEQFSIIETKGHFDNPIVLLNAIIGKKQAKNFLDTLISLMPNEQIKRLIEEIEERTIDSSFHMRIDKNEMLRGNISTDEKSTIKLKVQIPIYNKKETVSVFTRLFAPHLE